MTEREWFKKNSQRLALMPMDALVHEIWQAASTTPADADLKNPTNNHLFKRMADYFGIALGKDTISEALDKVEKLAMLADQQPIGKIVNTFGYREVQEIESRYADFPVGTLLYAQPLQHVANNSTSKMELDITDAVAKELWLIWNAASATSWDKVANKEKYRYPARKAIEAALGWKPRSEWMIAREHNGLGRRENGE